MKPRFIVKNQDDEPAEMQIRGVIDQYFDSANCSVTDTEQEVLRELATIPKGKKINVRVNSEGGSVGLALGIHNAFKTREDDITIHNAGYMLSSATLLPPAGARVVSPKSSIYMIHRPAMAVEGNIDAMQGGIECLKTHESAMASIYSERTGKSMKACREIMSANNGSGTWMTGEEAVKEGFADSDQDDDDYPNSRTRAEIDPRIYATFRDIPEKFRDKISAAAEKRDTPIPANTPHKPITSAAAPISAAAKGGEGEGGKPATPNNQKENMHKLITALVAAGFKLPAEATEDQVCASIAELISARDTLTEQNTKLKTEADEAKKARITAHVQSKVDAKIIKPELLDKWVTSIMEKPDNQTLLDAMEAPKAEAPKTPRGAAPPPAEPEGGTNEAQLADLREKMRTEKDPDKVAAMAIKCRELRGHKGLFPAASN